MFVTRRCPSDVIILESDSGTILIRVQDCAAGHVTLGIDCPSDVNISLVKEMNRGTGREPAEPARLAPLAARTNRSIRGESSRGR
jgi:hypothetical protein